MGTAEAVVAILSTSVTALGGMGSLLWWTYRRGQASGAEKARREADQRAQAQADAKIQALERLVAEMRAELTSIQPKRRRLQSRTLSLPTWTTIAASRLRRGRNPGTPLQPSQKGLVILASEIAILVINRSSVFGLGSVCVGLAPLLAVGEAVMVPWA